MPATAVTIIEACEGNDTLGERGDALMFPKTRGKKEEKPRCFPFRNPSFLKRRKFAMVFTLTLR